MLSFEEFTVGSYKTAEPGSLVLPLSKYEAPALICEGGGKSLPFILEGIFEFDVMTSSAISEWSGLIIHNIRIEVDEFFIYNPEERLQRPGIIVRSGNNISVYAKRNGPFGLSFPVIIKSGLPSCIVSAAFTRWQIVVGRGDERRILHTVDLGSPPID